MIHYSFLVPTLVQLALLAAALTVVAMTTDQMVGAVITIANRYRIPGSIAGATLAATATSAPELGTNLFAVIAASEDAAAANIGAGTIVGSAVFNLAVVIGLVGVAGGCTLAKSVVWRDGSVYAGAVALLLVFIFIGGADPLLISRSEGAVLAAAYALYLVWLVRDSRKHAQPHSEADETGLAPVWPAFVKLFVSIILVAVACHVLVGSTRHLSRKLVEVLALDHGAVTSILSLVVIAAATSAPDALTSLAAVRRDEGSLAISNAIGSNTFDILICLGLPVALIGGRAVSPVILCSTLFLFLTTGFLLLLAARGWSITRAKGVCLLLVYCGFLGLLVVLVL
jgi:cation:H+ antiporter